MTKAHKTGWLLVKVSVFFLTFNINAQTSAPDTVHAHYSKIPIELDGRLDEPEWQQALHISNFTQRELNIGERASERTEVAIIYTANTLYIGFWGYDSEPDRLTAREMKRDFDFDLGH